MNNEALIKTAAMNVQPLQLSKPHMNAASVGCALLAENGKIYEGVCIHLSCGLGFCAEAAAMAHMIRDGQTIIRKIVAVSAMGIYSPCGRCREMMLQIDERNSETDVILADGMMVKLSALLPNR